MRTSVLHYFRLDVGEKNLGMQPVIVTGSDEVLISALEVFPLSLHYRSIIIK
jgi:hypothetical protein